MILDLNNIIMKYHHIERFETGLSPSTSMHCSASPSEGIPEGYTFGNAGMTDDCDRGVFQQL